MAYYVKMYLILFTVFFIIDLAWLGLVAKDFYNAQIGYLMGPNVNWLAALAFYLLFIGGLLFFVLEPALARESWKYALLAGGFFGLVSYATYDLTNLATLKDWPVLVTIVDLAWGTVLGASTSVLSFFILKAIR